MKFDYEKAKSLLVFLLNKKKDEALANGNEERVKNIDAILCNDLLFEKLLDRTLLNEIMAFVESSEHSKQDNSYMKEMYGSEPGMLFEAINPRVIVGPGFISAVEAGEKVKFENPESMRRFLYDLVGFEYMSHKAAMGYSDEGMEVVDPLALYEEVEYGERPVMPTLYNLIDDVSKLENIQGPLHLEQGKKNKVY